MKCAFIYNPNSGKCKKKYKIDYIVNQLKTKYEVDVFPTERAKHAITLARNACGKYDILVVAGGDGTLSEVINGIAEQDNRPVIGYIPLGTVNDVGHSLKLSRNYKKAVEIILRGKTFKHDIFKAGTKYGIYVCCAGLFTETSYSTSQKSKKRVGKIAYVLHGIKKMFSTKSIKMRISYDGGFIDANAAFLMILNSRNVASFGINRKARLDDGKVDIMIIKEKTEKVGVCGIFRVLSLFLYGLRRRKNAVKLNLDKFKVYFDKNTLVNIDGELAGKGWFDFKVIKQGIDIIVP